MTFHQITTHYRQGLTMKVAATRADVKLDNIRDFDDAAGTLTVRDIATGLSLTVSACDLTTEWTGGAWEAPATVASEEGCEGNKGGDIKQNQQIKDVLIVNYTDRVILNSLSVHLNKYWSSATFTVEHKANTSHLHCVVSESTMNGEMFQRLSTACIFYLDGFKAGLKVK